MMCLQAPAQHPSDLLAALSGPQAWRTFPESAESCLAPVPHPRPPPPVIFRSTGYAKGKVNNHDWGGGQAPGLGYLEMKSPYGEK